MAPDLKIVFVAFEPGPADIRLRHHHARRNNQFWRLLAQSGLTPRRLEPKEDERLPDFGLGLLSVVPRGSGPAGRRLTELVRRCPPRVLAFTGKGVYLAASGEKDAAWGPQAEGIFEGVADFVLPSPSGKARMTFAAKLHYYAELAAAVDRS